MRIIPHPIDLKDIPTQDVLIKQPAGMGDVFYLTKMYKVLKEAGHNVIWPLSRSNLFYREYIKDVEYVCIEDDFPHKKLYQGSLGAMLTDDKATVINADIPSMAPGWMMMYNKYRLLGLSFEDWADYINLERNLEKEHALKRELGLTECIPYAVVNRNYYPWHVPNKKYKRAQYSNYSKGTDNIGMFAVDTSLKIVNMRYIDGYTVLDWLGVLEDAKEIYTMDTSITLFMQLLPSLTDRVYVFGRSRTVNTVKGLYQRHPYHILPLRRVKTEPPEQREIPRILHFIWLGSRMTKEHEGLIQEYREVMPDWEVRVHNEVPKDMEEEYKILIEKCSQWCQVADILRYWLIARYGGIYIDVDTVCVRPLDDILKNGYPFFAAHQPNGKVTNGVIGGVRGCYAAKLLLHHCCMRSAWEGRAKYGPSLLTPLVAKNIHGFRDNAVIFPHTYFHPVRNKKDCHRYWKGDLKERSKWMRDRGLNTEDSPTYTVTLWGIGGSSRARK